MNVHNAIFQIEILNQFIEYFFLKSIFEIKKNVSDLSLDNKLQLKNVIIFLVMWFLLLAIGIV